MNTKLKIQKKMRQGLVILDGATGTQLQALGMPDGESPEMFGIKNPEAIKAVHQGYLEAGSDIIYTCTFGANRYKLPQYGVTDVHEVNKRLAAIAKEAAGKRGLVAGDIGPTGRFVEPFGDLSFEDAVICYKEQVQGLLEGGVDLFVIETMIDIQETRAALIAIKEVSDRFTICSMTFDASGRTLNGTDLLSALITLQALGADVVGCNCSAGPKEMIPLIREMKPYAKVPLVAKPNAGLPKLKEGKAFFEMGAEEFSSFGPAFVDAGARLLGGCCGTTPEHIRMLRKNCDGLKPQPPQVKSIGAVSSHAKTVMFARGGPLIIIGERINPTGKKDLQQELLQRKFSLASTYARDQVKKGASILDINVGMPGLDEKGTLRDVVKQIALTTDAPLCIDTSRVDALEAALRVYPGRALINSISGEENTLDERLKLAAFYGAMFILLPIAGRAVPKTSSERRKIIKDVYAKAGRYGFTKDDIIVDALTMAVSADGAAALETLKTIDWCNATFGAKTVVGLSNVSFGLPERKWVNASFLAMAISGGLTCAIANPESIELMSIKKASDVLAGRDKDASAFISFFSGPKGQVPDPEKEVRDKTSKERIYQAVIEGDRDGIQTSIDKAIAEGLSARALVDELMVPAIRKVGELYEKKTYFLPQLIASAETMKRGFEHLELRLNEEGISSAGKGTIMLATVKGDIHDIGKNIVGLMLKNNGFHVIDLGKDVDHEALLEAARKHNPDIIGLSALMTTTMVNMQEAVRSIKDSGLVCDFLVGGAVVTADYAESIGADFAKDGVEAVRVAEYLISLKRNTNM
ncbi:MAG: homocysteine S-methyltransferase family protein [Desulfomonilia bacterium]